LGNFQNQTVLYNENNINSSTLINFAKQKAQTLTQGKKPYKDGDKFTNGQVVLNSVENIIYVENENLIIKLANTTTYKNKTIIVKSGNVILEGSMNAGSDSFDLFVDK